jgi:hypothetical protein
MGLSKRVATSLGKIPSPPSRVFWSLAMASGLHSPFRRIPCRIVGFPVPASTSHVYFPCHPVLGISHGFIDIALPHHPLRRSVAKSALSSAPVSLLLRHVHSGSSWKQAYCCSYVEAPSSLDNDV